jgi:hypothetical protein
MEGVSRGPLLDVDGPWRMCLVLCWTWMGRGGWAKEDVGPCWTSTGQGGCVSSPAGRRRAKEGVLVPALWTVRGHGRWARRVCGFPRWTARGHGRWARRMCGFPRWTSTGRGGRVCLSAGRRRRYAMYLHPIDKASPPRQSITAATGSPPRVERSPTDSSAFANGQRDSPPPVAPRASHPNSTALSPLGPANTTSSAADRSRTSKSSKGTDTPSMPADVQRKTATRSARRRRAENGHPLGPSTSSGDETYPPWPVDVQRGGAGWWGGHAGVSLAAGGVRAAVAALARVGRPRPTSSAPRTTA